MKTFLTLLTFFCILAAFTNADAASDCTGPWQTLQNTGGNAPCKALGLDSNRGICRPGDEYETLCDDAKGGQYRICRGPRRCYAGTPPRQPQNNQDCTFWDNDYNRPCPAGTRNMDCRGGCDAPAQKNQRNCQDWDYNYNKPCPNGFVNRDCQGGCEPR